MSGDPRDLIPLYTNDTAIRIRCVGGPMDGQTLTWDAPGGAPPLRVRLLVEAGLPSLTLARGDLYPSDCLPVAVYQPRRDHGCPSRDDGGVYLYEYCGPG